MSNEPERGNSEFLSQFHFAKTDTSLKLLYFVYTLNTELWWGIGIARNLLEAFVVPSVRSVVLFFHSITFIRCPSSTEKYWNDGQVYSNTDNNEDDGGVEWGGETSFFSHKHRTTLTFAMFSWLKAHTRTHSHKLSKEIKHSQKYVVLSLSLWKGFMLLSLLTISCNLFIFVKQNQTFFFVCLLLLFFHFFGSTFISFAAVLHE